MQFINWGVLPKSWLEWQKDVCLGGLGAWLSILFKKKPKKRTTKTIHAAQLTCCNTLNKQVLYLKINSWCIFLLCQSITKNTENSIQILLGELCDYSAMFHILINYLIGSISKTIYMTVKELLLIENIPVINAPLEPWTSRLSSLLTNEMRGCKLHQLYCHTYVFKYHGCHMRSKLTQYQLHWKNRLKTAIMAIFDLSGQ